MRRRVADAQHARHVVGGAQQIGEAIRQVIDGGAPMTPEVARKVLNAFAKSGSSMAKQAEVGEDYDISDRQRDILKGWLSASLTHIADDCKQRWPEGHTEIEIMTNHLQH